MIASSDVARRRTRTETCRPPNRSRTKTCEGDETKCRRKCKPGFEAARISRVSAGGGDGWISTERHSRREDSECTRTRDSRQSYRSRSASASPREDETTPGIPRSVWSSVLRRNTELQNVFVSKCKLARTTTSFFFYLLPFHHGHQGRVTPLVHHEPLEHHEHLTDGKLLQPRVDITYGALEGGFVRICIFQVVELEAEHQSRTLPVRTIISINKSLTIVQIIKISVFNNVFFF